MIETRNAILIDVHAKEVKEIKLEKKDGLYLQSIYDHLGCKLIDHAMYLNDSNVVYVDDEGLLTMGPTSSFFYIKEAHQPFIGNGIVVGMDEDGNTDHVSVTVEEVRSKVRFFNTPSEAREFAIKNGM